MYDLAAILSIVSVLRTQRYLHTCVVLLVVHICRNGGPSERRVQKPQKSRVQKKKKENWAQYDIKQNRGQITLNVAVELFAPDFLRPVFYRGKEIGGK